MGLKKRTILVIVILLLLINLTSFLTITNLTGYLTQSTQGEVSLCLDKPPVITAIADQSATVSRVFSHQVVASDDDDNASLSYYDNTTLFNITATGLISFTPTAGNVGVEGIEIKVEDNSGCNNYNSTTIFKLTVAAAPAEEEAAVAPVAEAGGGGAAPREAAAGLIIDDFLISEDILKIGLKQSQSLEKRVTVSNVGKEKLLIEIINPLPGILAIYPLTFTINAGEKKEIVLTFNPKQDTAPDVYFEQVEFKVTRGEMYSRKYLTIVLEIESDEILFDASMDLAEKTIMLGNQLKASISLFNIRMTGTEEIKLIYTVTDINNNVVYEEEELLTVEERVSFTKTINLLEKIVPGQYLFSLKILSGESFATAAEMFTIKSPPTIMDELAAPLTEKPFLIVSLIPIIALLLVIVLIVLFLVHKKIRKQRTIVREKIIIKKEKVLKPKIFVKRETIIKPKTIIKFDSSSRLRRKLSLLEDSFKGGFIKEKTYHKTKTELEKMIQKEESRQ